MLRFLEIDQPETMFVNKSGRY